MYLNIFCLSTNCTIFYGSRVPRERLDTRHSSRHAPAPRLNLLAYPTNHSNAHKPVEAISPDLDGKRIREMVAAGVVREMCGMPSR